MVEELVSEWGLELVLVLAARQEGSDYQDCFPRTRCSLLRSRKSVQVTISHSRKTSSELLVA